MITTGYCLRKLQEHVLFVNHSKGNVRFQLNHIQFLRWLYYHRDFRMSTVNFVLLYIKSLSTNCATSCILQIINYIILMVKWSGAYENEKAPIWLLTLMVNNYMGVFVCSDIGKNQILLFCRSLMIWSTSSVAFSVEQ